MADIHPETALVPFIRGELTGGERERVAEHLERCGDCRASAESFRAMLAELAARIDELPAPEWTAYRAELRRKLAARNQPRERWWWRPVFGWAGMATAAAAAAALALWFAVPGFRASAPSEDQLAMEQQMDVADVGLLRNYPVVQRLDLLENYDVIEHLDELRPAAKPSNEMRS